jgi:hypothetical protein
VISEQTIQVEVNGPNPSVRRHGDSLHVESATAWDGQRDVWLGGSMQGWCVRVDGRGGESDNRVAGLACDPQIAAGITRQVGRCLDMREVLERDLRTLHKLPPRRRSGHGGSIVVGDPQSCVRTHRKPVGTGEGAVGQASSDIRRLRAFRTDPISTTDSVDLS